MILRSKTEAQTTGSIGPGSSAFTIDKPAGVVDGDLLIIMALTNELLPFHNVRASPAVSAGTWTQLTDSSDHFIAGDPNSPNSQARIFWYVGYKFASSEPANWTFDCANGGSPPLSSFGVVTCCLAFRDADGAMLDTYGWSAYQGAGPYASPSLTPSGGFAAIPAANFASLASPTYGGAFMSAWLVGGDCAQIGGAAEYGASSAEFNSWTAPTGYGELSDINQPSAPENGTTIAVTFQSGPTTPPAGEGVSFDGVTVRA